MTSPRWPRLAHALIVLCALTGVAATGPACSKHAAAEPAAGPKTYHAVGIITSFGPAHAYVNIAHEDIPGYMAAMTMAFEPQRTGQLDGLSERDRVAFEFVETEDARRVLARIDKRP